MSTLTDPDLVLSIQSGRSDAEAALYQRYAAKVFYLALRESRSRHDAEDVRAETFLRVLQAIRANSLRQPEALAPFILGTTRNVLRELFERRKQAQVPAENAQEPIVISHEDYFLDREVRDAIGRTIAKLKPRDRDVLRMHFYEELSTEEIAGRSGIAPERVRLVKSRALKRFREFYGRLAEKPKLPSVDTKRREGTTSL